MKQLKITPLVTQRDSRSLEIYLKEIDRIPMITVDEELRLAKLAALGCEKSVQKLITSNLRFVVSIAKRYKNKDVKLIDIINTGNIGLIEAVRKFDHTKGFKLISYAVWFIRKEIIAFLKGDADPIRKPANHCSAIQKLREFNEGEQWYEDSLTEEDIAKIIGVPVGELRIAKFANIQILEMDEPIGDDSELTMEVEGYFYADSEIMKEDHSKKIGIAVSQLKKQQQIALTKRYGLDGNAPCQLDDVGLAIGKTRERARQVVIQAENELRKKYSNLLLR